MFPISHHLTKDQIRIDFIGLAACSSHDGHGATSIIAIAELSPVPNPTLELQLIRTSVYLPMAFLSSSKRGPPAGLCFRVLNPSARGRSVPKTLFGGAFEGRLAALPTPKTVPNINESELFRRCPP